MGKMRLPRRSLRARGAADRADAILTAQFGAAAVAVWGFNGLLGDSVAADGAGRIVRAERHPAVGAVPLRRFPCARRNGFRSACGRDQRRGFFAPGRRW